MLLQGKKSNPFVDLEAEEDIWDDADILNAEADDDFDDFIDDREVFTDEEELLLDKAQDDALSDEAPGEVEEDLDDEEQFEDNDYPLTAAAISHKALVAHNDMEQWRSLLAHAHERGRSYKSPHEAFDNRLEPLAPILLYRVRVKDGYEETAAMVLANKLLTAGTHFAPSVKAIIGRVSCPGWIFIESDGADASKLCSNVSDVYPRHIHPVVDDLKQYLYEPLVVPKEGDWVRLNSPPLYRGDLVYVHAYNDTSPDHLTTKLKSPGGEVADVLVVPQVEQFLNRTKGKGKAGRPLQQLLELKQAIRLFGAGAVKANDELNFTYLGQRYGGSLHYTVTHEFEPMVPTHEELALFQRCSFVEPGDIARGINEIAALSLQVTDRIVVTSGELVGMSGIITEFSGNDQEATIRLDSTEIAMDVVISPILLRKVV
ncbi:hypothetical protein DXG01_006246 [Tephrocybe rancida]|nr:hypothetical protein DXG01_006246 [Tephrocybe rancida]